MMNVHTNMCAVSSPISTEFDNVSIPGLHTIVVVFFVVFHLTIALFVRFQITTLVFSNPLWSFLH